MGANSFNKKRISLFFVIAIAGFLTVFSLFWNSPGYQKNISATTKSNKPFHQPQKLPERTSTQGGSLFSNRLERDTQLFKTDIKGPVQGKVTIIDWCFRKVFIDDVSFDMGSLDLTGVEAGDRVEVTYRETDKGRVTESIYVLR